MYHKERNQQQIKTLVMEFSSIVVGVSILLAIALVITFFTIGKIMKEQPSLQSFSNDKEAMSVDETVIFTLSDELDKLNLLRKSGTFTMEDCIKKENEIVSEIKKLG